MNMLSEDLLKEKRELKRNWTNKFLNELDILLEKCFLPQKKKKEQFLTHERLEIDFMRLLQSQKQYSNLKDTKKEIKSLAVYDLEENIIGRILKIDLINSEVEFENMHLISKTKNFDRLRFFDFNSLECAVLFDKQKLFCDKFTYRDTYRFLMADDIKPKNTLPTRRVEHFAFDRVSPLKVRIDYGKF